VPSENSFTQFIHTLPVLPIGASDSVSLLTTCNLHILESWLLLLSLSLLLYALICTRLTSFDGFSNLQHPAYHRLYTAMVKSKNFLCFFTDIKSNNYIVPQNKQPMLFDTFTHPTTYVHILLYTQTIGHYRKYIINLDTQHTDNTGNVKPCPHCHRKVRMSQKSATVADSRTFLRQSHFCATVSLFCDSTVTLFCDSVDRA